MRHQLILMLDVSSQSKLDTLQDIPEANKLIWLQKLKAKVREMPFAWLSITLNNDINYMTHWSMKFYTNEECNVLFTI